MDDFLAAPRNNFLDSPRQKALAPPAESSREIEEEKKYERENPEGGVDVEGERIVLWNFAVDGSELKEKHLSALKQWIGVQALFPLKSSLIKFVVVGHASQSGNKSENEAIALRRAKEAAAWFQKQGYQSVSSEARGASSPRENGATGYALARNRRVEIQRLQTAIAKPEFVVPEPPEFSAGGKPFEWTPSTISPSDLLPGSVAFESAIDQQIWPLTGKSGPIAGGRVLATLKLEGKVVVMVSSPGSHANAVVTLKNGKVAAKIEEKVTGWFSKVIFAFDTKGDGPAVLKVSGQMTSIPLEVGLQTKPQFVTVNVKISEPPPLEFELSGIKYNLKFSVKLKAELGPGPALIKDAVAFEAGGEAALVAGGATTGATVAGALVVTALIIGGTIYAIEDVKKEGVIRASLIANRDMFAALIAREICADDDASTLEADKTMQDLFKQYKHLPDSDVVSAAAAGYNAAKNQVKALKGDSVAYADRLKAWRTHYGQDSKGAADLSYNDVRLRIFQAVGGYDSERRDTSAADL